MKVLFTHSYFLFFDKKQWETKKPYPPLGTIQAASYLRENGFEVDLFDVNFVQNPMEIEAKLKDFQPDILVVYDDGFNYLTKMCLTNMREAAFKMIENAKEKNIHVIVSSSDSTDHFDKYLDHKADQIILGEADETLLQLAKGIRNNESLEAIDGIAYRKENETVKTSKRAVLKELDKLPIPAWDLVDIKPYQEAWSTHGYFSINLATTRGCPFKCNWCAKPIYGMRYNSRSPEHVVQEIKTIQNLFSFDHIWFSDDIFGLKPNWVQDFDKILKKEGIQLRYKIQSRADLLVKDDTIDALVSSGMDEVWIGAESGSQKILDAMDKGTTLEQIKTSTKLLQDKGARVAYFLQFGYLGENKEDIQKTIQMLKTNKPDDIGISVSYPLPGTPFYDKVKSQMEKKSNWEDSDDLDMMFEGTFSSNYYRALQRRVHHLFRLQQGWTKLFKPSSSIGWRFVLLIPYNLTLSTLFKLKMKK